jgi:hypothetical protein
VACFKANAVQRSNSRGGHNAAENVISALRCLYRRAVDDGLIDEKDNPASKVAKPRRLPSTRQALDDARLAQINQVAATTGDDPELDTLILRLRTETACRRGGALALRHRDLDREQCLIMLREKGETFRWQPVSPTLMAALVKHAEERHAPPGERLLRYPNGRQITDRLGRHRAADRLRHGTPPAGHLVLGPPEYSRHLAGRRRMLRGLRCAPGWPPGTRSATAPGVRPVVSDLLVRARHGRAGRFAPDGPGPHAADAGTARRMRSQPQRLPCGRRQPKAASESLERRRGSRYPPALHPLAQLPLGDAGQLGDTPLRHAGRLQDRDDRPQIPLLARLEKVLPRRGPLHQPAHLRNSQIHRMLLFPSPSGCRPRDDDRPAVPPQWMTDAMTMRPASTISMITTHLNGPPGLPPA